MPINENIIKFEHDRLVSSVKHGFMHKKTAEDESVVFEE